MSLPETPSAPSTTGRRAGRLFPLAGAIFLLAGVGAWIRTARAQDFTVKPSPTTQEISLAISDIDCLSWLNPLKLTPEQMDRITEGMLTAQADYDKQVRTMGDGLYSKVAPEVRSTKQRMLGGADLTDGFKQTMDKLQQDFFARRDKIDVKMLERVSGVVMEALTPKQREVASKLGREAFQRISKKPDAKGTESQHFNFYILKVFITYPRIVPLMQEIKAFAQSGEPQNGAE